MRLFCVIRRIKTARPVESTQPEEYLKLDFGGGNQKASARLRLLAFVAADQYVLYIPSLNLSAYGNDAPEALGMIHIVLADYFSHLSLLNEQQVLREINQYGWVRKPFLPKQLRNIQIVDEKSIKEDFELPAETVIHEQFVSV